VAQRDRGSQLTQHEMNNCAAVCGDEVRLYGAVGYGGRRPLLKVEKHANHGSAVLFAQDYDDRQRGKIS